MQISEVTRRNLMDEMAVARVCWSGRLDEPDFLSRLYDLTSMPSHDGRYDNAWEDVRKHQVMNRDWDDFWVFTDPRFNLLHADDGELLRFLAETLHPVVRASVEDVEQYLDIYNRHLRADGFELHVVTDISGEPVYGARSAIGGVAAVAGLKGPDAVVVDSAYLGRQITRIESSVQDDPELAIGTAKELVETVAKSILDDLDVDYNPKDDLPGLLRTVRSELELTPEDVDDAVQGADAVRRLYGSLGGMVQALAEIRNLYGTGHGKMLTAAGVEPRHARLAAGSAATLATFLWETVTAGDDKRLT